MVKQKKIVLGVTGASGAVYALGLLRSLLRSGAEVHLVVSGLGGRLLSEEAGIKKIDHEHLMGGVDVPTERLVIYPVKDVGAKIASGSFRHDGMIVGPCSSKTLGMIANGCGDNLIHRAAHVTLKERRVLVLLHREMPLNLIDINNMQTVTQAGAVVLPASPGFYMKPKTIEDLVDFVVGRVLDLLDIEHELDVRWEG